MPPKLGGFTSSGHAVTSDGRLFIIHLLLASENPFSAALDDSVKIYQWLLTSGFKPGNIIIAGESAGGGLCLAILLALKERNMAFPAAAVAISPWTDLTCSSKSYQTKNKVSLAPPQFLVNI